MMFSIGKDDAEKEPDELRKVIFLDIDGVLQEGISQERFAHDLDALQVKLAEEYDDEGFMELDKYDIGAVYYD